MAKVRGPLFSMEASGKQGALVYARNPYGQYTRAAPGAALSPSGEQIAWRDAMSAVVNTWQTDAGITAARRAQWEDFAKSWTVPDRWGRRIKLDAGTWFRKFGLHRQRKGLGLHLGPPIDPDCNYYPTLSYTQTADGLYVDAAPRPTGDQMICLSRVLPQSVLRNFCPSKRTYLDHLMAGSSWPYQIWTNAELSTLKRYFFVTRVIDGSGRPSVQQMNYLDAATWVAPEGTYYATEDTRIKDTDPTTNYGTDVVIMVRNLAGEFQHSLIQFDVSEIPEGVTIETAELYCYCTDVDNTGNVTAHEGLRDWAELEATWNNRLTGVTWGQPGGQSGLDFVAVPEDTVLINLDATWFKFDIPVMVQNWLDTPEGNHGVWLRYTEGAYNARFASRETLTPEWKEYLFVTWSV